LLNETASKLLHPPQKSLPSESLKAKPAANNTGNAKGDRLDQPRPSTASNASASPVAPLKQNPQMRQEQPQSQPETETETKPESDPKPKPRPQPQPAQQQHITMPTGSGNNSSGSGVSKNGKQRSGRKFK